MELHFYASFEKICLCSFYNIDPVLCLTTPSSKNSQRKVMISQFFYMLKLQSRTTEMLLD